MTSSAVPINQDVTQTAGVQTTDAVAAQLLNKMADFAMQALGQGTLRRNIHNYNGSLLAYTHHCDMANKLGLTEEQKRSITPFPDARPTNVTMNVNSQQPVQPEPPLEMTPESPGVWSKVWPWLLAGATGLGGAAVTHVLQPDNPPAVESIEGEVGLEVE